MFFSVKFMQAIFEKINSWETFAVFRKFIPKYSHSDKIWII